MASLSGAPLHSSSALPAAGAMPPGCPRGRRFPGRRVRPMGCTDAVVGRKASRGGNTISRHHYGEPAVRAGQRTDQIPQYPGPGRCRPSGQRAHPPRSPPQAQSSLKEALHRTAYSDPPAQRRHRRCPPAIPARTGTLFVDQNIGPAFQPCIIKEGPRRFKCCVSPQRTKCYLAMSGSAEQRRCSSTRSY